MRLSELARGVRAVIRTVDDIAQPDPVAGRLRDLGFVAGEAVRIVAQGPFGGDPLLVKIGSTQFALRRAEAARVRVQAEAG
jgi:ferrous iron transport protein A